MIEYLSKEKRFIMSKIKDATKRLIVEEASKLFLSKSIQGVTMSDIAREAEIGEATLYRYFGKKQNIVVEVAIMLFEKIYVGFTAKSYGNTGKSLFGTITEADGILYTGHSYDGIGAWLPCGCFYPVLSLCKGILRDGHGFRKAFTFPK